MGYTIFIAYLLSIAATLPIIHKDAKVSPTVRNQPISSGCISVAVSMIPVANIILALCIMIQDAGMAITSYRLRRSARKLKNAFKDHPDQELKDSISDIADKMTDISKED